MRRGVAVVALGLLLSCARTSGTVEIPAGELPFPVARAPSPTGSPAPNTTLTVYFVRGGRLVPSPREVGSDLPTAEAAARALLEGPSPRERAEGIVTELPSAAGLLGVGIVDGIAIIDLSGEFQEPAPPERISLRVAQMTWTLTDVPGVREVAFAIDGERVSVTADDGTTLDRPVRRSDYDSFAPA